ncbi:hypothetical protein TGGT1_213860 [Toxoplasma gondii GT1]|uniref:Uncharacterized protein n=5 Tax=Toxoplasma gondii TaxID=5811 RepID=S7UNJ8_TOXGG|nr:hypothetical protein TGGT1_213860 [Toxoplasma gondii GT1]KAF4643754.1 hypothetical protein TGRH88_025090 [Toxoplasma gondii]KFG54879.1 hypothetical protein TGFOU_213860 [Toxoplasma gondii FOU]PUA86182.1 hypothetical protein TGBR9_213860 [Toxoplasma gondii TgCATBr9]RQX69682.1 hypothetical protein TGCAST_213860 [Toxoplasma gondii CAST]
MISHEALAKKQMHQYIRTSAKLKQPTTEAENVVDLLAPSHSSKLESNVANAVKQARAYKADKSELKCKLQRLSQEERLRAEEAQRTCDALSTEVRHARGSAEKLAAALKDCLLEKRSILSFLTEVFSTPPDTSTLIKPSAVQNAKLGGRELLGLMGNLEIEIHDAAMHLHHMLQRIREESKYTDTVFDSNLQSFTVEELIHRLLQERQDSGGSCVLEDACHCPTLPVTCRIDWRLEKDRYLRLKHVINRKVAQLLKVQKLAKSGATAAANRCPLY